LSNYESGKDNYIHGIQHRRGSSTQILVEVINVHQYTKGLNSHEVQ